MSWKRGNPQEPGKYLVTIQNIHNGNMCVVVEDWIDGKWCWLGNWWRVIAWDYMPEAAMMGEGCDR